jgi:hypothetical protein
VGSETRATGGRVWVWVRVTVRVTHREMRMEVWGQTFIGTSARGSQSVAGSYLRLRAAWSLFRSNVVRPYFSVMLFRAFPDELMSVGV